MTKKQIALYSLMLLLAYDKGGVLQLLPDYAQRLGAPPAVVGYYLAFCFLALTVGTFAGPLVARRAADLRPIFLAIGLVKVPVIFLHGHVNNVGQLIALNGLDWFLCGVIASLIPICVGLLAGANERGRLFGIIASASALGAMVGSLMGGALIAPFGYSGLFNAFALTACALPLAAFLMAPVSAQAHAARPQASASNPAPAGAPDRQIVIFLAAAVVAKTAAFMGIFGVSITMLAQHRPVTEIALMGVVGNGVGLVVPLLTGRLSDRIGRGALTTVVYTLCIPSLIMLAVGNAFWHFAIATVLRSIYINSSNVLGPALLTDIVARDRLGRALSWWGNSGWIGAIAAFATMGMAIQAFGIETTLAVAAVLMTAATIVTIWVLLRRSRGLTVAVRALS